MKIIRWLINWGSLYLLAVVLIGALIWVQSLNLKTSADDILSIALLIIFAIIVNNWVDHHPANFKDIEIGEYQVEYKQSDCREAVHHESQRLN